MCNAPPRESNGHLFNLHCVGWTIVTPVERAAGPVVARRLEEEGASLLAGNGRERALEMVDKVFASSEPQKDRTLPTLSAHL